MKTNSTVQRTLLACTFLWAFGLSSGLAQAIPGPEENINYIVTFGKEAPGEWGDDDHLSIFFAALPTTQQAPFYIRIYDPDTGGKIDEAKGGFNTTTRFSIYGGKGAYTEPAARGTEAEGNYLSGVMLHSKTFGASDAYDGKWYTFGPINPAEGEKTTLEGEERLIFKIVSEGKSGDDGNLYRYFFSVNPKENISVEGLATFTFEYNFRMEPGISHIYPFIDSKVVRIRQHNFDFDGDGYIRIVSVVKKAEMATMSVDGEWRNSTHDIFPEERNKCLDFQVVSLVNRRNNNVAFVLYNQYGEALPFMNAPIGLEEIRNKIKVKPR